MDNLSRVGDVLEHCLLPGRNPFPGTKDESEEIVGLPPGSRLQRRGLLGLVNAGPAKRCVPSQLVTTKRWVPDA